MNIKIGTQPEATRRAATHSDAQQRAAYVRTHLKNYVVPLASSKLPHSFPLRRGHAYFSDLLLFVNNAFKYSLIPHGKRIQYQRAQLRLRQAYHFLSSSSGRPANRPSSTRLQATQTASQNIHISLYGIDPPVHYHRSPSETREQCQQIGRAHV